HFVSRFFTTFCAPQNFVRQNETSPCLTHAIRAAIDEALKAKEAGESKCIVFNLSGHGHLDLFSYDKYLSGQTEDVEFSEEELQHSLRHLPRI
ncbi:MAG: TrpB-like pyridoxal-phosphate dependent enzyme, partial [Bacillota bacterium]|nr:TrpB-like pyridoxal-phosphate dependent enzyme [Bacillota bacterium]